MSASQKRARGGLETLSMRGDHTFIFERICNSAERGRDTWWVIEQAQAEQIDNRLWEQKQQSEEKAKQAARDDEVLPPGWCRMEVGCRRESVYLHESGYRDKRRPVPDASLPVAWTKLEEKSQPESFSYVHCTMGPILSNAPVARGR